MANRPALLARLPTIWWKPGTPWPLVREDQRARAPELADDFEILDRELVPRYREHDEAALRSQNEFRLGQVAIVVGGGIATALGSVQAALGGGNVALGIAEGVITAALTAGVFYVRQRNPQRRYMTSRLKAERLRSEYFVFLSRTDPYDVDDRDARAKQLRDQVRAIEHSTAG
jgi:hypothetical protein